MRFSMRPIVWLSLSSTLLATTLPCGAQQSTASSERVTLQSRVARAESAATRDTPSSDRRSEASLLRSRLRDGDFHPGDRITLWVNGEPALSGTFTVRAGNVLVIPSLHELPLQGVLRSELRDVLLREIRHYIKDPEIQVTTLVNIAVLGSVSRPGFYAVAPDAPITDVLMTAGGPAANADFGRSRVVRDGVDFAHSKSVRRFLEANSTLDEIGVQSGDQIIIGERTHRWQTVSAVLGVTSLLATTVVLLAHR
jgi:polysaccharide biosynthesis/export protein